MLPINPIYNATYICSRFVQEVCLGFQERSADQTGAQALLRAVGSCNSLQALRITAVRRLEFGGLPRSIGMLPKLAVLRLHNAGIYGRHCLPCQLPALEDLAVVDAPAWHMDAAGNWLDMSFPASLAAARCLTALVTTCVAWDAGLPDSLQVLNLDLTKWAFEGNIEATCFKTLSTLVRLTSLHISSCQGSTNPPWPRLCSAVQQLSRLRYLGIESSDLTTLPEQCSFLSRLTALSLARNKLSAVPNALKHATNCKLLDISDNQFAGPAGCLSIHDIGTFAWCTALRKLGLCTSASPCASAAERAQRIEVLSALNNIMSSHCGPGEVARLITSPNHAFDAEMGMLTAPRDAFELDSGWGN